MDTERKTVLVTGGAGFIGSHCISEILKENYEVICIDNMMNCVEGPTKAASLLRIEEITGKTVKFYPCDLLDKPELEKIFQNHKIDYVIHFAAMKSVGESMKFPLIYYRNNVVGTMNLLELMKDHNVSKLVFSSSCTVYGDPKYLPLDEIHPTGDVSNVYGRTKYVIEEMLKDLCHAEKQWQITSLRYFNPVGAHPSGLIGEDPTKNFSNIMPYLSQVALGKRNCLSIFGDDYPTEDGTGVRDYIHIMDLATGHLAALRMISSNKGFKAYNLGTGEGVSVLQLVKSFEKMSNREIKYEILPRRDGDIAAAYSDSSLAQKELDWKPVHGLDKMCEDYWRWQTMNPNGYRSIEQNGQHVTNGSSTQ